MRPAPDPANIYRPADFEGFVQVPTQYVVRVELQGQAGSVNTGSTQLRPAPFVPHRITFATVGDIPYNRAFTPTYGSLEGRACRVSFGDPFTQFFGDRSALCSAVFGDSQGFLDLPRSIVLQGSQPITVTLERLFWPLLVMGIPELETLWDFTFHGIELLPPGVHQAGSAG